MKLDLFFSVQRNIDSRFYEMHVVVLEGKWAAKMVIYNGSSKFMSREKKSADAMCKTMNAILHGSAAAA